MNTGWRKVTHFSKTLHIYICIYIYIYMQAGKQRQEYLGLVKHHGTMSSNEGRVVRTEKLKGLGYRRH